MIKRLEKHKAYRKAKSERRTRLIIDGMLIALTIYSFIYHIADLRALAGEDIEALKAYILSTDYIIAFITVVVCSLMLYYVILDFIHNLTKSTLDFLCEEDINIINAYEVKQNNPFIIQMGDKNTIKKVKIKSNKPS